MAKKKKTRAQAAAARRPDDWVSPQAEHSARKARLKSMRESGSFDDQGSSKEGRRLIAPFVVLFVVAAIAAPFIVIYASRLFGIA